VIPEAARAAVARYPLCFVASLREDGAPNLSPKGSVRVWDADSLVFADIASPGTVANVTRDPRVEVNVVDHFARRGWRFRGVAEVTEDPAVVGAMREEGSERFDFTRVVLVRVESCDELISPSYGLGKSEADLRAEYLAMGDEPQVEPGLLGVRRGVICQVCERARTERVCPLDCRYCEACAQELELRCRNCGGALEALTA
jgi:uncharacterized protein